MAAFRLAWEEGVDAVEFDVHLTRDGRIAVIHDDNTLRTTGCDRRVGLMTLDELKVLDAGRWKDPRWRGESIPELAEVLASGPTNTRFFIEVKCGPEILPELERTLRITGARDEFRYVVLSFDLEVLRRARSFLPHLELLWNVELQPEGNGWRPTADELIGKAREASADTIGIGYGPGVEAPLIRALQQARLKVFVWTVDEPLAACRLAEQNVDYLASNRPGFIREQLRL